VSQQSDSDRARLRRAAPALAPAAVAMVLAVAAAQAAPAAPRATWMPVAYRDLIADSDLIVAGKIAAVDGSVHDGGWWDCARISVAETLKGAVPPGGVRLDYPARRPAALGGEEPPPAPTAVIYEDGQEGIWFLKRDATTGHFVAGHPARFRPMPLRARVRSEVARAAAAAPGPR
jgi:hypothetical protein